MEKKRKQQHQTYKCPVSGCDAEVTYKEFLGELIMIPADMSPSTLKRIPPDKAVARNMLVECPVHGPKMVQKIGHHSDLIGKQPKPEGKVE